MDDSTEGMLMLNSNANDINNVCIRATHRIHKISIHINFVYIMHDLYIFAFIHNRLLLCVAWQIVDFIVPFSHSARHSQQQPTNRNENSLILFHLEISNEIPALYSVSHFPTSSSSSSCHLFVCFRIYVVLSFVINIYSRILCVQICHRVLTDTYYTFAHRTVNSTRI